MTDKTALPQTRQKKAGDLIRDEIRALRERDDVTYEEWQDLRANSWEREHLIPALTNSALAAVAKQYRRQIYDTNPYEPATTYDEALIHRLVPEMEFRLRGGACSEQANKEEAGGS